MIVAIDGPAGAGKSTVARAVAERLGFQLLETGALYRAVGLLASEAGVALDDEAALARIAATLDLEFRFTGGRNHVFIGGVDRSDDLRTQASGEAASRVSALPAVRAALLDFQRELAAARDSVMEGRDIGTVVVPDAELKFFVTASVAERARRRFDELKAKGEQPKLVEIEDEIRERDERDSTREVAPLRAADDATVLDTTGVNVDDVIVNVVDRINALRERGAES